MTKTTIGLAAAASIIAAACGDATKFTGDAGTDTTTDWPSDITIDPHGEDGPGLPSCSDDRDNDGDDLVDLDDWDCESPTDGPEGPAGGCTMDTHCAAGWEECEEGTCEVPLEGALCEPCTDSGDCGDGLMDGPDRDFCVYYGMGGGNCSHDCMADHDCPRGFYCEYGDDGAPPGYCVPIAGSCAALENVLGGPCTSRFDCMNVMECVDETCAYECTEQWHCPTGTDCTDGFCL